MRKIIYQIGIALVISSLVVLSAFNYLPLEPIQPLSVDENYNGMLGTSITTIAGSDTLKASRTVINDNFTALNTGKIETSITTLPLLTTLATLSTVGTIGTGTWNADAIGVGYGGTGTTSPTSKQIMIGNGANGLQVIGFGAVGQFLVSAGDGSVPQWTTSSIDEAGDYDWTGVNTGIGIVGEVIAYASSTVPTGWLAADGSSKATTTYANLFAVLGYGFGGSGANFNLPNLSGRNIIGYGSATTTIDTMGETGGEDEHLLSVDELPGHTHSAANQGTYTANGTGGTPTAADATAGTTGSTGGDTAHNVLDPFIVLQYIIKF